MNELVHAAKTTSKNKKMAPVKKPLDMNDPVTKKQLYEELDVPKARQVFKEFLMQIKSVESLEFVVIKSNFHRSKKAPHIFLTFVKKNALKELNLERTVTRTTGYVC